MARRKIGPLDRLLFHLYQSVPSEQYAWVFPGSVWMFGRQQPAENERREQPWNTDFCLLLIGHQPIYECNDKDEIGLSVDVFNVWAEFSRNMNWCEWKKENRIGWTQLVSRMWTFVNQLTCHLTHQMFLVKWECDSKEPDGHIGYESRKNLRYPLVEPMQKGVRSIKLHSKPEGNCTSFVALNLPWQTKCFRRPIDGIKKNSRWHVFLRRQLGYLRSHG